jgi:hypothetical protein
LGSAGMVGVRNSQKNGISHARDVGRPSPSVQSKRRISWSQPA